MGGSIYILENKINGKCYVGQTININRRLKDHKIISEKQYKKQQYIHHAIIRVCKYHADHAGGYYWKYKEAI